jgi:hypothetical protein
MSKATEYSRGRRCIAIAVYLAATLSSGCQSPIQPGTTGRLNLPNSVEPLQDAPKRYRPDRTVDPDYMKHPSRWRTRLKARYA